MPPLTPPLTNTWATLVLALVLALAALTHADDLSVAPSSSIFGHWRGRICSVCGCGKPEATPVESWANLTVSPDEVIVERPAREACGKHRDASVITHEISTIDDTCVLFVSGADSVRFSMVVSSGVLHVAYAPELSFCPTVPYVPRATCAPIGETRAGFYGVFIPMHAKYDVPPCYHDADQMTLRNPMDYAVRVIVVAALLATAIEMFTYRFLMDK